MISSVTVMMESLMVSGDFKCDVFGVYYALVNVADVLS